MDTHTRKRWMDTRVPFPSFHTRVSVNFMRYFQLCLGNKNVWTTQSRTCARWRLPWRSLVTASVSAYIFLQRTTTAYKRGRKWTTVASSRLLFISPSLSLPLSLSLSVSLFLFFFLSTYVILKTKPSPFHLFVFHLWHREGGLRWPRTCVNVATSMSSNVHAIWHWHYRRNNCFPFGLPPPLASRKREELWKGGWNKRLVEMVWFLDTRNPLFRRISPFRLPIDWHLKFIFKFVTKIRL